MRQEYRVFNTGDANLPGVTVYLDINANGHFNSGDISTTTNGAGAYTLNNLVPGTYIVRQVTSAGYARTAPLAASATLMVNVGAPTTGPVFGDVLISSVTLDFNYLVKLSQNYTKPATFATGDLNGSGTADFDDLVLLSQNYNLTLPNGSYITSTTIPGGANVVSADQGATPPVVSSDNSVSVKTQAITAAAIGAISGNVYNDANGDGTAQKSEVGLAGRTLYLDIAGKGTTGERSAKTDSTGHYSFTKLPAGSYVLHTQAPGGWRSTTALAAHDVISLAGAAAVAGIQFGETQQAVVSGAVLSDANGDKKHQTSELGLAGWTVQLISTSGSALKFTTMSDAAGAYAFASVPKGTYRLSVTPKSAFAQTSPAGGIYSLKLVAGEILVGQNFGEHLTPTAQPYTISSTRIADAMDLTRDVVTFYARNNAIGALAGTKYLLAEDATLSSGGGLEIRAYDSDGSGVSDDSDFAGENVTPAASYIRIGGPAFFVASTTPTGNNDTYKDFQSVSSFEVAGALPGGGVLANAGGGARIAVAVTPHGDAVSISAKLAAESGPLFSFSYTDKGT